MIAMLDVSIKKPHLTLIHALPRVHTLHSLDYWNLTTRPQRDYTGKMGFNEFKELFTAINGWKQNFMMFDQDRSGTVEPHEMSQAINSMGEW